MLIHRFGRGILFEEKNDPLGLYLYMGLSLCWRDIEVQMLGMLYLSIELKRQGGEGLWILFVSWNNENILSFLLSISKRFIM